MCRKNNRFKEHVAGQDGDDDLREQIIPKCLLGFCGAADTKSVYQRSTQMLRIEGLALDQ